MKIKVGDFVRCINNGASYNLTINKVYEVLGIDKSQTQAYMLIIINDYGERGNYYNWRFELDICNTRKHKLEKLRKEKLLKLKYDSE